MPTFRRRSVSVWRALIVVVSCLLSQRMEMATAQESEAIVQADSAIIQTRSGIQGGIRKLAPGNWGLMQSEVRNLSAQAAQVVSVIYFDQDPGLQYARKVWLPPKSTREFWIPVLIPPGIVGDQRKGEFVMAKATTMLLDISGESEIVLQSKGRQLTDQAVFSVDTEKPITVQIAEPASLFAPKVDGYSEDKIAHMTVQTMRIANGFGDTVPNLFDKRMPVVPALLDSADQIVLSGNGLATDAPGRTALRQWVQDGGKMWVMLDQMDEETCRLLLGDQCPVDYVDRVGLVEFESRLAGIDSDAQQVRGMMPSQILSKQVHETPVEFVRTLVDDVEVIATINGWPSIFKKNFGRGTILFTTIGARGLSRPREPGERLEGMEKAVLLPQPDLKRIARVMFAERKPPPITNDQLTPLIQQSVGYEVPGRGLVLLILSAFCLVLTLIGLYLAGAGRLGQLIWIAPATALISTIPLLVIGSVSRQAIPPTLVEVQLIESTSASDDVFVRGLAGVFDNQPVDRTYAASSTGVFVPDRTGINDTWRMVWNDLGQYQWENVSMPSGLRLVPYSATDYAFDPVRVEGSFGPEGFIGRIEGPMTNVREAFVASSTHVSLGINIEGNQLTGPVRMSLPPGQYTTKSLLDDEQIRHQDIYRKMLDFKIGQGIESIDSGKVELSDLGVPEPNREGRIPKYKFPDQPCLIAWSDGLDLGFEFNDPTVIRRSAVIVAPIQLSRSDPGKTIQIPSVFLPYESVNGPNNEGKSMAYDGRLGIWQKRSRGSASNLRFQLPDCILPFDLESARLRIKVNAPSRTIEIQTGQTDGLVAIEQNQLPVGVLDYSIDDRTALQLDERGGLHVRIQIGDVATINENQQKVIRDVDWKIDYVELQVTGQYSPAKKKP